MTSLAIDENIGSALAEAVLKLEQLGEARHWDTFAMTGSRCRYNAMRHLELRGWIEDANAEARREYIEKRWNNGLPLEPGEPDREESPFWRYPYRWRLTDDGREAARMLRQRPEHQRLAKAYPLLK